MIKYILIFIILFPTLLFSQSIPVYTFTMHDSTVTGYYFLASVRLGNMTGITPTQLILNAKGEIIYYNSSKATVDFKLLSDGRMSYCYNSKFYILDSTFTIVDSLQCYGYVTDSHDMQMTANHHYFLMCVKDTIMDLTAYHYFYHNGTIGSPAATVRGTIIQELDSNKNLVFEWNSFDHYLFDDVSPYWLYDPNFVDWTHCNALEQDTDGNILLSTRHFNEITKIDHSTGNIMWHMGGKHNQFTFYNEPYQFRGQHDIRRLANGNLTLYDNGRYFVSHGARGIEYQVDEANLTATLVWSYIYDSTMSSIATGNMQRVSDHRSLVNFGSLLTGNVCFSFVDSLNNPLSELSFADSSFSYRTFFYPTLPWSFNRPQIYCYQQGNDTYLGSLGINVSYLWSTGDTTQVIQITTPGIYYVDVPYGEGFIRSEKFIVTNLSNPCGLNEISETGTENIFSVSPNPVTGDLIVINKSLNVNFDLKIYDLYGREIFSMPLAFHDRTIRINTRKWNNGIYFLHSGNYSLKFIKN